GRRVGHREYSGGAGGGDCPGEPVLVGGGGARAHGHAGQVAVGCRILCCCGGGAGAATNWFGGDRNGLAVGGVGDDVVIGSRGDGAVGCGRGRWALLDVVIERIGDAGGRGLTVGAGFGWEVGHARDVAGQI